MYFFYGKPVSLYVACRLLLAMLNRLIVKSWNRSIVNSTKRLNDSTTKQIIKSPNHRRTDEYEVRIITESPIYVRHS
jgi:hypothetical protein